MINKLSKEGALAAARASEMEKALEGAREFQALFAATILLGTVLDGIKDPPSCFKLLLEAVKDTVRAMEMTAREEEAAGNARNN